MTHPNRSHAIREKIREHGAMTISAVADLMGITEKRGRQLLAQAASKMVADGILVADRTARPFVYSLGRVAADRKTLPAEVYQERDLERHREFMRKRRARLRAAATPEDLAEAAKDRADRARWRREARARQRAARPAATRAPRKVTVTKKRVQQAAPKPLREKRNGNSHIAKPAAPKPRAETVEEWQLRTGQRPEQLHSALDAPRPAPGRPQPHLAPWSL